MSRIEVDADTLQYRVVIPPVKKLPPNLHIYSSPNDEIWARAIAPPSETGITDGELSFEPRELKGLRHKLLACDQRSFLTGSAVSDLEVAHIINAIRTNPTRKMEVENFLTQQRLQPPTVGKFGLDSVNNAILLEASLHTQWRLYGTYCIVPAEPDVKAMLDALRRSNEEWGQFDPFLNPTRPLDVTMEPFNRPLWDIIVLHPQAMLPDGQALGIAQNRTFYIKGQPLPESNITWTWWITSGDHLSSNSPPNEQLPSFIASDVRTEIAFPTISSLAMVINAHCKLDLFMRQYGASATPRIEKFAQLISDLVSEIFFVPDGFDNAVAHKASLQIPQHGSRTTGIIHPQPAQAVEHFSSAGYESEVNSPYGTVEKASATYGGDGGPATMEAPEVSDVDGLTDSEFRLVSARARDPHLDGQERANAAMMMLFGTRRPVDPYVDRMQAIHG